MNIQPLRVNVHVLDINWLISKRTGAHIRARLARPKWPPV